MPETPAEAYARGAAAGEISTRLDAHDNQLAAISKVLTKLAEVEARLTLAVQELAGEAKASRETALALAEGVEKERSSAAAALLKEKDRAADTIRMEKDQSDRTWTPFTRFIAALVAAVSIAGLYIQSRP